VTRWLAVQGIDDNNFHHYYLEHKNAISSLFEIIEVTSIEELVEVPREVIDVDKDVDQWCATLRERGVPIMREPADYHWGDREFSVHDPDGHVLIFYGPSSERVERPEAV